VKYAFISKHRDEFSIQLMCRILGASKSGFYDWLGRDHDSKQKRQIELKIAIERAFLGSRRTYGSPRIYQVLKGLGYEVSEDTVAKLMVDMGLRAKTKKRFKVRTTDSKHTFPVAENKLAQQFEAHSPGEVMLSDVTFIGTGEGWLYLAGVLDLCTRRLIGWSMGDTNDRHLALDALHMALRRQKPTSDALFHSDRGSPYACYEFQGQLVAYGLTPSMSRSGNCYDNAPMESFFHTLKTEFVHHEVFATRAEAKLKIFEWIESFYNRQRLHSSLGYKTPVEFAAEKVLDAA
jgi:transposase InsO family protein